MERLTRKTKSGNYTGADTTVSIRRVYDKMGVYEDAEEQGLLLKLPCKVGDTIYIILHNLEIKRSKVVEFEMVAKGWAVKTEDWFYLFEDFGKTVFLTQAEAEEALKRLEVAE